MSDQAAASPNGETNNPSPQEWISGHFELLEELGQGSSGTVYRARLQLAMGDLRVGDEVAIKFLRRELLHDPDARQRLETEGRVGKQIRSEQVVRIYAVEHLRILGLSATYLVMELVRGRSLRQVLLDSGSVVEELCRRIGLDTCKGLRTLHALGLVHRDIKPENLALTDEGAVKVMDLGLVRRVTRRDADPTKGFYGSLSYAAPELLRGEPAQPSSDLYSLGVVLYELATGRHPFAGGVEAHRDADDMIEAHLRQTPPRPSHFKPRISAFLEELILDLLAKNPSGRPRSAADLEDTLRHGENSRYWIRHEKRAPLLASRRRLRNLRRVAEVEFVGRRDERKLLDGHLRSAMEGSGRAVLIAGPPGIGRRRLLDEWLDDLLTRRNDVVFLGGEAKGGSGLQRAAPFSEMLLDWFLRGDRPDSPKAPTRIAARIAAEIDLPDRDVERLAGIVGDSASKSTPEERADLIVRLFLAMRPAGQTMVIRVDLAEELSTTANLVVQRLTDEIVEHPVLLLLVGLDNRRPLQGMHEIPVRGLSAEDFLALGDHMFAQGQRPDQLLRDAQVTLAGNPGNLIDALAVLARDRKILGSIGNYRLVVPVEELRPAQPLLTRLRQRVAQLSPEQRFVHVAAAVLGPSFPIADLAALVGQSELHVLEALSVFQGRIVITHRGTGRFRHRDFRKELLKITPPHAQRRLHRTAAWVLEDRGAPALEVGLHLSRAGEHAAAIPPLLEGLEHLTATGSRQGSQRVTKRLQIHFDQLGAAADPSAADPNGPPRLRFLMLAARAHSLGARFDQARAAFEAAAALAHQLGDRPGFARAQLERTELELARGQIHDALAQLDGAVDELPETGSDSLRARALALEARAFGYLGRSEPALERIRQSLELLPEDDEEVRPNLLVDLGRIEALRNHFVAALKSLEKAHRLFEATGAESGQLRVMLHQGRILSRIGSRRQADSLLNTVYDRARQLSNERVQAKARLFLGQRLVWFGANQIATPHFHAAAELAERAGDRITGLWAEIELFSRDKFPRRIDAEVRSLRIPSLEIAWMLAQAEAGEEVDWEVAAAKAADIYLPLQLHLALLRRTGQDKAARQLIREISQRLPAGLMRRRFVTFARR